MFNDTTPPSTEGVADPNPSVLELLGYTDAAAYLRLAASAREEGYLALVAHYEILAVEAARPLVLHLS